MPELERITVTLSHDEWQWVLSLVMNSAYIRAKPIVEATEAAVKTARQKQQQDALTEQGERDLLQQELRTRRSHEDMLITEANAYRTTIRRLERRIDGYKGKLAQERKKRKEANGHTEIYPEEIDAEGMHEPEDLIEGADG